MRYASFSLPADPVVRLGAVGPDGIVDLAALTAGTPLGTATASLLSLMAPNVVATGPIIKHVFEACRLSTVRPLPRPDLSVGCSIVRLRIDHMFGNRTHERLYSNIRAMPQRKGAGR